MALSSQFSLSVELTKLIPFAPLARATTKGLLDLLRELQSSGSDVVTEEDLSLIFGRNRIDPKFERTFRTAVRQSVIHQVQGIAELVLEAGAGPTVRRSLKEPIYFSTIVQLSLLTWTHELTSLARSLAQTLDRRARGSEKFETPPRYDPLKGTLRAVREQTSGFMWELILCAVYIQIDDIIGHSDWYETRPIDLPVLQVLLDGFTAVQHLPETTLLRINTRTGIPTIVVWAHHVLGLSVVVESRGCKVKFGDEVESVYINTTDESVDGDYFRSTAALLNETNDLLFQVSESSDDAILEPACRHSVLGYGLRILELYRNPTLPTDVRKGLIDVVLHSCLALVHNEYTNATKLDPCYRGSTIYPTDRRLLKISKLLFPGHEDQLDRAFDSSEHPCLAGPNSAMDLLPPDFNRPVWIGTVLRLSHLLLILSMTENIENLPALSLELEYAGGEGRQEDLTLPNAPEAFEAMTRLIQGREPLLADCKDAAVISAWGWSICTSSIIGDDPSQFRPGLAVFQGVPMREGERKRLILDTFGNQSYRSNPKMWPPHKYEVAAAPGDSVALGSWTRPEKTRYFIGVSDNAFEVAKIYVCRSRQDPTAFADVRVGFRFMQETCWRVIHLPACDHPVRLGQTVILPPDTSAFHGFGHAPYAGPIDKGTVHIALVAGDNSARWLMLCERSDIDKSEVLLRSADCCFDCAINLAIEHRQGRNVYLVL